MSCLWSANRETTSKNPGSDLVRNPSPPSYQSRNHIFGHTRKDAPHFLTEAQLEDEFRRFDSNRDGYLSRQELKNAFNSLGSRCPTYRSVAAIYHADEDGDGYISKEEMDKLVLYALSCGYRVQ